MYSISIQAATVFSASTYIVFLVTCDTMTKSAEVAAGSAAIAAASAEVVAASAKLAAAASTIIYVCRSSGAGASCGPASAPPTAISYC